MIFFNEWGELGHTAWCNNSKDPEIKTVEGK